MLNCKSFTPFDVLRFPYEFKGDPETKVKLWIVARNVEEREILICFKPTSVTTRYDKELISMKGVVEYKPGDLPPFSVRTIIDPESRTPFPYSYLRSCYANSKFEIVGKLPDDFRDKMLAAVERKPEWRRKNKDEFFRWFE